MEFFRHCPQCGRRFNIRLVAKQLVDSKTEEIHAQRVSRTGILRGVPLVLDQDISPTIVFRDEFRYAYKCKHCGHEWFEKHTEEERRDYAN